MMEAMDAEQTTAEIEWQERIFSVPYTRPLDPSDFPAANRWHDETLAHSPWCGFGSGVASVAEPSPRQYG